MKTKSFFSSLGLFAVTALLAVSSASAAIKKYHFIYSGASFGNTAVADGVMTIDDTLFANPGDNGVISEHTIGAGQPVVDVTMTVSGASSGNGTFTTPDFGGSTITLTILDALDLNIEWVGQPQPTGGSTWGLAGTSGQAGDLNFFSAGGGAPNGQFYFLLVTNNGGGDPMTLTSVKPFDSFVYYTKGDAVPGVAGATFTSFGVPAANDGSSIAFLGKWKSPAGSGAGIFVNSTLVAKVGDDVSFGGGVLLKALKDPVIDADGHVAFPATLKGAGITSANDSALISNQFGTAAIVAEEGTQALDAPAGALYKSFTSVALPGGGQGPLFLAALAVGPAVTSATAQGLWSTDPSGGQHLVLQAGTTVIDGKTVKSFKVLKSVSGTPGQTHAFDASWHVLSEVTFSDGSQSTVDTLLPGGSISAAAR